MIVIFVKYNNSHVHHHPSTAEQTCSWTQTPDTVTAGRVVNL